ncbi:MAG: hypothetical protein Q4B15_01060 [Lachnospiraceae bacterium]|nr:hypothetical protein [Lachnospiraceae bacterium]
MSHKEKKAKAYRSYLKEFRNLREDGCELIYPTGEVIEPKRLAETMAEDSSATYMRDYEFNREGRVIRVTFTRVRLDK